MSIINLLELGIILISALAIVAAFLPNVSAKLIVGTLLVAAGLILIHAVGFHFRWQIIPTYIVILIFLLAVAFSIKVGFFLKVIFSVGAFVFLAVSLVLSLGMPTIDLPAPDGPLNVGIVSHEAEYQPSEIQGNNQRHLQLKIWYPADIQDENPKYETLWNEFHDPNVFSGIERFLAGYLKNIKTNSVIDAQYSADENATRSVVIYNHSALSTATENTILAETLASHGYVVVGIRHRDQRPEYFELQETLTNEQRLKEREDLLSLGGEMDRDTRAKLSRKVYSENKTLAEIVRRRTLDSSYVLDILNDIVGVIPGCEDRACVDLERIAFLGMSLGGAVSTEVCKTDTRCKLAINLDGGVFGSDILSPIKRPYLMLYSPLHTGGNDFLKEASGDFYTEYTIEGAKHADFHDATIVIPGLRLIGMLGDIAGKEMIEQRNARILNFLTEHLQGD